MHLYNKPFSFGGCRESTLSSLIRIFLPLNNLSNKLDSTPAIRHALSLSEGKCKLRELIDVRLFIFLMALISYLITYSAY